MTITLTPRETCSQANVVIGIAAVTCLVTLLKWELA